MTEEYLNSLEIEKDLGLESIVTGKDKEKMEILPVSFHSHKITIPGTILTPTQVKDVPKVSIASDDSYYYTLVMTDPDAPSRSHPKFREWIHWVVTDIKDGDVHNGKQSVEYVGAGPPQGTGLHRYCLFLFAHKEPIHYHDTVLHNNSGDGRGKWNLRHFIEKYKLGAPVAFNCFQAEYDDYVPILYQQLSGK